MWVQQLNKLGLISLSQVSTMYRCFEKTPRDVLDKLTGMMGYTFPSEDSATFQTYTNFSQNNWDQKVATTMKLPVFDDGEDDELYNDIHSFVDKTTHLTTAVLRWSVEMHILKQPYLNGPP